MKIRTLFFKAFGPFTNAALDFSGPANLHLIYGSNEAGKSSALRAIADLRYGIPVRSKDDFVHEFKDMLLAGCFEDVAGRAIGLARRKGNKDPLMNADPVTGVSLAGSLISPEVLLALTGGVAREQFETMYGLDSEHLRKGGKMLIQGEGDEVVRPVNQAHLTRQAMLLNRLPAGTQLEVTSREGTRRANPYRVHDVVSDGKVMLRVAQIAEGRGSRPRQR